MSVTSEPTTLPLNLHEYEAGAGSLLSPMVYDFVAGGELATARAVLMCRLVHWGLAVGGESGVRHVLDLLTPKLARDLLLCGLSGPAEADRSLLVRADGPLAWEGWR